MVIIMNVISTKPANEIGTKMLSFVISQSPKQKDYKGLNTFIKKETEEVFGNNIVFSEFGIEKIVSKIKCSTNEDDLNHELRHHIFRNYVRSSINQMTYVYDKRALERKNNNLQDAIKFAYLGFYLTLEKRNSKKWLTV